MATTSARPEPGLADHSVARDSTPPIGGPNKFKFGVFGANAKGGMAGMTQAEGQIQLDSWAEVERLARQADQMGLEGFIPIARWKSLLGPDRTWGRQYETFTWAAGLAAATERIQIFSTCHVPFVHPMMAAKMCATVDHISGGRMALNVVAGYFGPEFEMFDSPVMEHDERYAAAREWIEIMKRLWSDEGESFEFDFEGEHYRARGAESYPKPVQAPYPVIMSAGLSPAGQDFAFDHADMLFMAIQKVESAAKEIAPVRAAADARGREDLSLWAMVHIICKDTEEEARAYERHCYEERVDWEAGNRMFDILTGGDSRSLASLEPNEQAWGIVRSGAAIPIVGTPERVAEDFMALSDAGLDGAAIAMVDYDEGLDRLDAQILPLMEAAGLRVSR
jgi:alkanesulfonate monooxygenase SsuD/methylene tetrahydromethanopterin reductase-like flavin-dependent oxidoreductase (luciferase family)